MFRVRNRAQFINIRIAIILIVFSLAVGVGGFIIIEHLSFVDALYMAVITISTVGFGEVHELSPDGKLFTIFLIFLFIATFTYSITVISSYVIDGEFNKLLKKRKMDKIIQGLNAHVIVVGYGRNGRHCSLELSKTHQNFVIIEKSSEIIEKIKEDGFLYLEGDATEDTVLIAAGIGKAKSLITTLPIDADNVFVTLTARKLCSKIDITSRASDPSAESKLLMAGVNHVVMPEIIGGHYMASLVTRPDIIEFYHLLTDDVDNNIATADLEFDETKKEFQNKTIYEMQIRKVTGVNVIAIKDIDGKFRINPTPDTHFNPNTTIIVLGSKQQIEEMNKIYKN